MVHVVELRHGRVAGLGHLDVGLRGDRLERIGVDAIEEPVHRLAPRPEAVVVARLDAPGAPRERALERVRMQVRHRRHDRPAQDLAVLAARARGDRDDRARVVDVERDVARPAVGQQCIGREEIHCSARGARITATSATDVPDVGYTCTPGTVASGCPRTTSVCPGATTNGG